MECAETTFVNLLIHNSSSSPSISKVTIPYQDHQTIQQMIRVIKKVITASNNAIVSMHHVSLSRRLFMLICRSLLLSSQFLQETHGRFHQSLVNAGYETLPWLDSSQFPFGPVECLTMNIAKLSSCFSLHHPKHLRL